MKKVINVVVLSIIAIVMATSCTTYNQTMREPSSTVKFTKEDFTFSEQVSAEATTIKVLGVDWVRLFTKKTGNVNDGSKSISGANIPVIGSYVQNNTKNYALYNLMDKNEGYDVVFYPQYETKVQKPFLGIGFIVKKTKVKATARLGKFNN